jgi:hypothetical protein
MEEEYESMHQKPLLRIYQTDQPKQDKDKTKDYGDKRKNHSSEARVNELDKEHTHTTKSDKERTFQNKHNAVSGVPQNEIDQHKADKALYWQYGRNSHHMLEYFTKKTLKGMELAIPIAAITKKGKSQRTADESDEEDEQNLEPVIKRPKKVTAITQTLLENMPKMQSRVWEIETSEEELN